MDNTSPKRNYFQETVDRLDKAILGDELEVDELDSGLDDFDLGSGSDVYTE